MPLTFQKRIKATVWWMTFFCFIGLPGLTQAQIVQIRSVTSVAKESGKIPAVLELERLGELSKSNQVLLLWGGTAKMGEDYENLPKEIVFEPGQSSVRIEVKPINDALVEANSQETVTLQILAGTGYSVGSASTATVLVEDNDTYANSTPFVYGVVPDSHTSAVVFWTDNFETEIGFRIQFRPEGSSTSSTMNVAANLTSFRVTNLIAGLPYEFRVAALSNSSTTSAYPSVYTRAVILRSTYPVVPSTFAEWRQTHGLDGSLGALYSRSTEDPDGDGVANLLEYALGSLPNSPDPVPFQMPVAGSLAWSINRNASDFVLSLEESTNLTAWVPSSLLPSTNGPSVGVSDSRFGTRRFYRLSAGLANSPTTPSSNLVCWGDSLTAYTNCYPTMLASNLGRTVWNGGIGGDTSTQITERMLGATLTSPFPYFSSNTPAGTPLRLVASRSRHSRVMNSANRSDWMANAAKIANVQKVEFFNLGLKIGESINPLSTWVSSDTNISPTRLLVPGHPFSNGTIVHFPAGPLPSPLVVGKTYYVRDADAGGFALVETDTFVSAAKNTTIFTASNHPFSNGDTLHFPYGPHPPPLIANRIYRLTNVSTHSFSLTEESGGSPLVMLYDLSNLLVRGALRPPLVLGGNFSGPTFCQGPFVLDWIHPGGPSAITIQTHTDRDNLTHIFWMGRNNINRPNETYADLRLALQHMKNADARFLILGTIPATSTGETLTPTNYNGYYNGALNLSRKLHEEFPREFIDIREFLIGYAPTTGETVDATDRAKDLIPTSFRTTNSFGVITDSVHLNDAGQQAVADAILERLQALGW